MSDENNAKIHQMITDSRLPNFILITNHITKSINIIIKSKIKNQSQNSDICDRVRK